MGFQKGQAKYRKEGGGGEPSKYRGDWFLFVADVVSPNHKTDFVFG